MRFKLEDMRDWLRDYYIKVPKDLPADPYPSIEPWSETVDSYLEDLEDAIVAEAYVALRHGDKK